MNEKLQVRRSMAASAVLMAALFLLPVILVEPYPVVSAAQPKPPETKPTVITAPVQTVPEAVPVQEETRLRVLQNGQVIEMALEEYLVGVVRAEMPASFEPEALKAQAVAARTYTLYKMMTGGNHGPEADICTDSTCCQAYLDAASAAANWGERAEAYEKKVAQAVADTAGQAVLYDGQPILAVFHAASAGLTRKAGEVWSSDLPYLQAVPSAETGAEIPNYYSRAEFSAAAFREKVLAAYGGADFFGSPREWITQAVTDSAGNVKTVNVGGVTVRGSTLRALLGLRSACFTWEVQGDSLVFFVTGYGHGVGLSQHGANQMAKNGAGWQEILLHYYTDVSIGPYRFTNDLQT